jgi:RimJ/RimL family protein N-acetyltransferase
MTPTSITLHPWADDDLALLHMTLGNATMMKHLGGVETPEQITSRHQRYLRGSGGGGMFTIRIDGGAVIAGSIGFWDRAWQGEDVYEAGWMVLAQYAGRGIATAGARTIIRYAKAEGRHRFMHAYPSVENQASNAVCRSAGFTNLGACMFEYPKGRFMQCADWCINLRGS